MLDVLLITGGAGSGKTSTAEAWAASRPSVAAHLSHDDVHTFVKSGVMNPADGSNEEADRQWRIAIDICVAACRIYVAEGIRCAIDTYLLPTNLVLWSALREFRVGLVVLRPDVDVAARRNAKRQHEIGWGV
ncbi:MAG TPA: AAA family ATPase, partial [Nitrolancea sp.]|nr:AAA family ATPase [Nitrolancea sp.]